MVASKQELVREVRHLSSGTLASLSGHRDYEALDKIQLQFLSWLDDNYTSDFKTWVQAWNAFQDSLELKAG